MEKIHNITVNNEEFEIDDTTKLPIDQGSNNAGKYLKVGADGNITAADLPVYTGVVE